jgi:hypothetical protein
MVKRTMGEDVTRREFIKVAGAAVGGVAIGAVGGYSLMPPKETIVEVPRDVEVERAVPEWPWTYQKLDPESAAQRAYDSYWVGGCSYAGFNGIVGELQAEVGFPFTQIPPEMLKYGGGGGLGWGMICGALNGALAAMNIISNEYSGVGNELIGWYTEYAFPSYEPSEPTNDLTLVTSVSGSPLCHVSVTTWSNTAGVKESDTARKERCARLVADVVKKAVELMNAQADGTFAATFAPATAVTGCQSCHGKDGVVDNVATKDDCSKCHEDPH